MINQIGYYVYNMVLTTAPDPHTYLLDNLFLLQIVEFLKDSEDCFQNNSSFLNDIFDHKYTSKVSNCSIVSTQYQL